MIFVEILYRMKIKIPTSWEEMTDYQQRELIHLINKVDSEDFFEDFVKIVQIMLMKKRNIWQYLHMRKILRQVPISIFQKPLEFILEKPKLYIFPKIKGLSEPAPRIGDLTAEQFSICDTLLYRYSDKEQADKREIHLRQLVASLYKLPNEEFDKQKLPTIAKITDKISLKEAERIAFIFSSVRMYIADSYPSIFQPKKDEIEDEIKPVFKTKKKYTPFSQIIVMMAADELRLLGTLKECQKTPVYDFFNAFLESKKIHKIKADATK